MAYKLIKDGHVWDYSTHLVDVLRWGCKVRKEEPDAVLEIEEADREEMLAWKSF
jgi:hypothetical protein